MRASWRATRTSLSWPPPANRPSRRSTNKEHAMARLAGLTWGWLAFWGLASSSHGQQELPPAPPANAATIVALPNPLATVLWLDILERQAISDRNDQFWMTDERLRAGAAAELVLARH